MEKRFKHRKTKEVVIYKDGVWKQGNCCVDVGHEPSNEFWEDVTEYYEILEIEYKYGAISSYQESLDNDLKEKSIYKVKRVIDGEVFTIGDNTDIGVIKRLRLPADGKFQFSCQDKDNWHPLSACVKVTEPLLTTEDGVEMYDEHISYYLVTNDFKIGYCSYFSPSDLDFKLFAKIENARTYVEDNKKRYSRKEIQDKLDFYTDECCMKYVRRELIKHLDNGNI